MELQKIYDVLWMNYTEQNPSVKKVYDLFINEGEEVKNDHIAFRTFNNQKVNIDVLARVFIECGYELKGTYQFEAKKLNAKHYEHKTIKEAPRVFISELRVEEFSDFIQETVSEIIKSIPKEVLSSEEIIFSGNTWGKPSYDTYQKLREESEYAAWLYVFGYCANHFTVSVNALKKLNTVEKVNNFLKKNGFRINDSGGEIKGTPEQLLEQSSILSEMINVDFEEGSLDIPGCYYEFARRYPDSKGKLYSGFIAKSADKIFESTDYQNKKK